MNVRELIDILEDYDDDTEVLFAHQPSWPLAETVAAVVPDPEIECGGDCADGECDHEMTDGQDPVVWIVAGGHPDDRSPYAPAALFESIG